MATPVLLQSDTYCTKCQAHPRLSECDCGQIVLARSNHPDGMVPSSGGVRPPVSNLASSTCGHVCDQVQLQTNGSVVPDTHLSPKPPRSGDLTIQHGDSQGSDQSQPSCMAPRAESIREQGFSSGMN